MLFIIFLKTVKGLLTQTFSMLHPAWGINFSIFIFPSKKISFIDFYTFVHFFSLASSLVSHDLRYAFCFFDHFQWILIRMNLRIFLLFQIISFHMWFTSKLYEIVVTAIQGLIDAADEQLSKRGNSEDLSKVSTFAFIHYDGVFWKNIDWCDK